MEISRIETELIKKRRDTDLDLEAKFRVEGNQLCLDVVPKLKSAQIAKYKPLGNSSYEVRILPDAGNENVLKLSEGELRFKPFLVQNEPACYGGNLAVYVAQDKPLTFKFNLEHRCFNLTRTVDIGLYINDHLIIWATARAQLYYPDKGEE
jgi:hypothetical protein